MFGKFGPQELLVIFVVALVVVWPCCRICSKAGFPPFLGLLALFPVVNFGLLLYVAFAEWPALKLHGGK